MSAMEKQIMSVWEKSLHDLPDMAELSGLQGANIHGILMFFLFKGDSTNLCFFCCFLISAFGWAIFWYTSDREYG